MGTGDGAVPGPATGSLPRPPPGPRTPTGVTSPLSTEVDAGTAPYVGPAGTVVDAEEPAAAIVFLASDASDASTNINGAVLPVDHGWSAV